MFHKGSSDLGMTQQVSIPILSARTLLKKSENKEINIAIEVVIMSVRRTLS